MLDVFLEPRVPGGTPDLCNFVGHEDYSMQGWERAACTRLGLRDERDKGSRGRRWSRGSSDVSESDESAA